MAGYQVPKYFGPYEKAMYFDSAHYNTPMINDTHFAELFHDSFFETGLEWRDIEAAREELKEYVREHYGFEFFEEWDWEWYREWYKNNP